MIAISTLAVLVLVSAQEPDPPHRNSIEFQVLARCQAMKGSAVGEGGETPPEVHAFRMLLERSDAAAVFSDLLASADATAGKLYALCGLYYADHEAFTAAIDPWRSRDGTVSYQWGCTVADEPIQKLVSSDHPHPVRLRGPDDTVREWSKRAREADNAAELSYDLDIVGGGIPADLADRSGWDRDPLPAVTDLIETLRTGTLEERVEAAGQCAWLGPRARAAQPELLRCLEHDDDRLFAASLWAIRAQSYWALDLLPQLYRSLDVADRSIDRIAEGVRALTWLTVLHGVVPPKRPPWFVRQVPAPTDPDLAGALFGLDTDGALPEHVWIVSALPERAVATLVTAIRSDRDPTGDAIDSLSYGGEPALDALLMTLDSCAREHRASIAHAIVTIGQRHPDQRERVDRIMRTLRKSADLERIAEYWFKHR